MSHLSLVFAVACLGAVGLRAANPDDSLLSAILTAHIRDGRVDYPALKGDARLGRYLEHLAATDPESLGSDQARLAFWLNAYNAYTLKLIVDSPPVSSIVELGRHGLIFGSLLKSTAWDIRFAEVGGKKYTLNEIEHEIIRRRFGDFRAHFALNCGSNSCPILRPEAYTPERLEQELDDQARRFMGDAARNRFDPVTRTAWLSSLFNWYRSDFGRSEREVLLLAARYAPAEVRADIERDPGAWTLRYLPYDWSLNTTEGGPAPTARRQPQP